MSSLTPAERSDEAVAAAAWEGTLNGLVTLIPSIGLVGLLYHRHPTFRFRTTAASRTALSIMPAMFVSALSSELKLNQKMREMANEQQHQHETVVWAQEQWHHHHQAQQLQQQPQPQQFASAQQQQQQQQLQQQHLSALLQESIAAQQTSHSSDGTTQQQRVVQIVPTLHWYHHTANFISANPLKVLTAVAVPAVGYIFYGRSGQAHLQWSSMIMHTRVMGQGLTLASLLGIMAFKNYMDQNIGQYISQDQADTQVAQLQAVQTALLAQLDAQEQHRAALQHEIDLLSSNNNTSTKSSSKSSKSSKSSSPAAVVAPPPPPTTTTTNSGNTSSSNTSSAVVMVVPNNTTTTPNN